MDFSNWGFDLCWLFPPNRPSVNVVACAWVMRCLPGASYHPVGWCPWPVAWMPWGRSCASSSWIVWISMIIELSKPFAYVISSFLISLFEALRWLMLSSLSALRSDSRYRRQVHNSSDLSSSASSSSVCLTRSTWLIRISVRSSIFFLLVMS